MNKQNIFKITNFIPIIALGSLMITLFLWAGAMIPKINELAKIQKDIKEKGSLITREKEHFTNLKEIDQKLAEKGEEMAKIGLALPDSPDIPSLFDFIQKTASYSGMVLEGLGDYTVSNSLQGEKIRETVFSIQVSGSYEDFKNFLSSLENSSRLINVDSISFNAKEEEENNFSFNLSLETFSN
ncbi:MAG: type 4a pilus biogenesis protein PilO [Candidatus Pacebacteria bacterium]|nr:type 4a pilus biogenesis protein PilO [Candidatus Paceibacterota bacterium]